MVYTVYSILLSFDTALFKTNGLFVCPKRQYNFLGETVRKLGCSHHEKMVNTSG